MQDLTMGGAWGLHRTEEGNTTHTYELRKQHRNEHLWKSPAPQAPTELMCFPCTMYPNHTPVCNSYCFSPDFVLKLIHFSKILKDPIGPQLPWWHRIAERTMALEKCSLENEGKVMNIGFPLSYVLIFINLLPLFTKEVFLYYKMSKIL